MLTGLPPDLIRRWLTSIFPAALEDIALARDVVQRHRTIDITMLVWTLIMGFTIDGEARTIAGFQRAYAAATNQTVARSSFYDRLTPALAALLSDLLEHPNSPAWFKIRSSCFHNVSALPEIAEGGYIADLIATLGRLDIVLGSVDR